MFSRRGHAEHEALLARAQVRGEVAEAGIVYGDGRGDQRLAAAASGRDDDLAVEAGREAKLF